MSNLGPRSIGEQYDGMICRNGEHCDEIYHIMQYYTQESTTLVYLSGVSTPVADNLTATLAETAGTTVQDAEGVKDAEGVMS
jgi:hypothetical protein